MNEVQGETVSKMNPEVKARWVAALRSGEYKQGTGALREGDCFCCLGVLCDLTDSSKWLTGDEGSAVWSYHRVGITELPPTALREIVGLNWDSTEVVIGGDSATLADHNDAGRTFTEIADAIEAQL